jgi:hypothetical protein
MTLTMTWGSDPLPLPDTDGIRVEEIPIAASKRALSGRLHVDVMARYHRISATWTGLTASEWTTLAGHYAGNRDTPSTLVLPDGQSFTNVVCTSNWPENQWFEMATVPRYDVTLEFEETLE